MIELVSRALAATIDTSLPGPYSVSSTGPVAIVGNIYYFALGIGGLLAFGSIVYAGIKWAASQGNPSSISDAKDQITQAALGLVMLMGAYIILNTINPQLTMLQIPKLTAVKEAAEGAPPGGAIPQCGPKANGKTAACSVGTCEVNPASTGDSNYYRCQIAESSVWVCYKNSTVVGCYVRSKSANCNSFCQGQGGDSGGQCQSVNPAPASCPSIVN